MVRFEVQTLIQFDPYGLPLPKVQLLSSEKVGLRSTFVSILQPRVRRGASIGECPMFQKHLVMESMWLLQNKTKQKNKGEKKKCDCSHELINMDCTI